MSHHRSLNHTRQATPGLPTLIQRVGLYYARTFHRRAGLPAAHTLSQATIAWKFAKSTRERRAAAHALMTSVFHVDVGNMCSRLKKATPVFLSFLHRHSVCDYQRLLSRHCPLKPYSASQDGVEDVMSHAVPHSAVSGFVRAVLRAVIPKGLLGSFEVENVLFKRVSQFVSQQRGDVMRPCDVSQNYHDGVGYC
jgi:Telomerase ribonucleoprotein complex - RNA binding domain